MIGLQAAADSPQTPTGISDSRPQTPGSNQSTLKSSNTSLERISKSAATGSSGSDEKLHAKREHGKSMNRNNDVVYMATTNVVKAIMALSQGVEKADASQYLDLVKNVGFELRALLASVDQLSTTFTAQAHK